MRLLLVKIDGLVKSRHPVEKRGPGFLKLLGNTGFRLQFIPHVMRGRNDGKSALLTFFKFIKIRGTIIQRGLISNMKDVFSDLFFNVT